MAITSLIKLKNLEEFSLENINSSDEQEIISEYLTDEAGAMKGEAEKIFFPETEEQVVSVLKWAYDNHTPVTISGGGTGITSSRVPLGGVILSTDKLVKVRDIPEWKNRKIEHEGMEADVSFYLNSQDALAVVPAGLSLNDLNAVIADMPLYYPPNPTEWSSLIGGNVSTNASGGRSFKLGAIRPWVKRLRVILPTGELLEVQRGEIFADDLGNFKLEYPDGSQKELPIPGYEMPDVKNASGLFSKPGMDLIDLFIGSEGILGVITEVEFGLYKNEDELFGCIVFFGSEADSLEFVKAARHKSRNPESVIDAVTLDYFDKNSLEFIRKTESGVSETAEAAVFFEQFVPEDPDEVMMEWMEFFEEFNVIEDWSALTDKDRERLRLFRHSLPENVNDIVRRRGVKKMGMDLAVPDDRLEDIFKIYKTKGNESGIDYVVFGHIGDNNLHMNFMAKDTGELQKVKEVYLEIAREGIEMGGTISAEHGVGKKQFPVEGRMIPYLQFMYPEDDLKKTARVKKVVDPEGLLNRGNVIPESYL
ncbi:MAG: FAD-binding oxidoreductase [Vulcanimicrobiota bacterium]